MTTRETRLVKLEAALGEPSQDERSSVWVIGERRIDFSPTAPPQTWVIAGRRVTF